MKVKSGKYIKIIPPSPVVLVSTLHGDVKNVAPFGMNMLEKESLLVEE